MSLLDEQPALETGDELVAAFAAELESVFVLGAEGTDWRLIDGFVVSSRHDTYLDASTARARLLIIKLEELRRRVVRPLFREGA
jgi:hypothetical protein